MVQPKKKVPPRLPDGAVFQARYDAKRTRWEGALIVPGCETVTAVAPTLFTLMPKLDRFYRNRMKQQKAGRKEAVGV